VEVVQKLQEVKTDTPILVITAHYSVPVAIEAMKAGAYDYITKPFNLDELKLVVMHALERKKLEEEVKEKKLMQDTLFMDSLTQAYNRRFFDELLQHEEWRAKRYPQKFTLLIVDIDDFRKFNDRYGTQAGDKVLSFIGAMLKSRVRNTDSVARFGGEEFAIITPHTEKKNAMVLASRLVEAVAREQFNIEGFKASVTVSIGLSTFNEDAFTKESLMKTAEEALFQAKKLGKNRVCLIGSALKRLRRSGPHTQRWKYRCILFPGRSSGRTRRNSRRSSRVTRRRYPNSPLPTCSPGETRMVSGSVASWVLSCFRPKRGAGGFSVRWGLPAASRSVCAGLPKSAALSSGYRRRTASCSARRRVSVKRPIGITLITCIPRTRSSGSKARSSTANATS
jgi:diguanylate cyclase (GGDEF)-like protein